jgi:hypothetical protein
MLTLTGELLLLLSGMWGMWLGGMGELVERRDGQVGYLVFRYREIQICSKEN